MNRIQNTPEAAWNILAGNLLPLEAVTVPLGQATGRYLSDPVTADRDIPPADRSAMDGFAIRADASPGRLRVVGEVPAGGPERPGLDPGTCVRIYTGANVPPDADRVIPVEQTSLGSFTDRPDNDDVEILTAAAPGANIFRRGENARAGEVLLPVGTRLGPRQLAVAATVGQDMVSVHRPPVIRILNTGRELLGAADPVAAHQTRDSNGPLLEAAFRTDGFTDVSRRIVPDTAEATVAALTEALTTADAVVLTGGISAGRYDFVPGAVAAAGGEIALRRVAMKPGRPQLFARTADGRCIFGLPGNPLSVIVGLYEFVLPALRRLAGCPLDRCRPEREATLAAPVHHHGDRLLVLPAILRADGTAEPRRPVGSADLVTGGRVDGAILLPPNAGEVAAGERVRFRPWGALDS